MKKINSFIIVCAKIKFAISHYLSYSLEILFQIEDVSLYKFFANLQTSGNQFLKDED